MPGNICVLAARLKVHHSRSGSSSSNTLLDIIRFNDGGVGLGPTGPRSDRLILNMLLIKRKVLAGKTNPQQAGLVPENYRRPCV